MKNLADSLDVKESNDLVVKVSPLNLDILG